MTIHEQFELNRIMHSFLRISFLKLGCNGYRCDKQPDGLTMLSKLSQPKDSKHWFERIILGRFMGDNSEYQIEIVL